MIRQDRCAMKVGLDGMLLGAYTPVSDGHEVLDIGTGTGVLSLMLAQKARCHVDAIEIDENAFMQASDNVKNSSFSHAVRVIHSSLQDFQPDKKYDLIISNPPFFSAGGKAAEYRDQNRQSARNQGSLDFETLAGSAGRLLKTNGLFYCIIPCNQKDTMLNAANNAGLFPADELRIKSFSHSEPKRAILGFAFNKESSKTGELIIYREASRYSDAYKKLTEPFHAVRLK